MKTVVPRLAALPLAAALLAPTVAAAQDRTLAPPACALTGAETVVLTGARYPGAVSVAQRGDQTAIAFVDTQLLKVVVLGRDGGARGPIAAATSRGEVVRHVRLMALADGFALGMLRCPAREATSEGACTAVVRPLSAEGALGPAVVLAAHQDEALFGASGGVVLAASVAFNQLVRMRTWSPAGGLGARVTTGLDVLQFDGGVVVDAVEPTPAGFAVVYRGFKDDLVQRLVRLDGNGRRLGEPVRLRNSLRFAGYTPPVPLVLDGQAVWHRRTGANVELRADGAPNGGAWTAIDPGGAPEHVRLLREGSRSWLVTELEDGRGSLVPLDAAGRARAGATSLPGPAVALDGARGGWAGFRDHSLRFQALACVAPSAP